MEELIKKMPTYAGLYRRPHDKRQALLRSLPPDHPIVIANKNYLLGVGDFGGLCAVNLAAAYSYKLFCAITVSGFIGQFGPASGDSWSAWATFTAPCLGSFNTDPNSITGIPLGFHLDGGAAGEGEVNFYIMDSKYQTTYASFFGPATGIGGCNFYGAGMLLKAS